MFGEPVVTNLCAFSPCTQGCGCVQAPGIPCALVFRGHDDWQNPGELRRGDAQAWLFEILNPSASSRTSEAKPSAIRDP
jgi:hypothetical protein